jgi:hypothetical protein
LAAHTPPPQANGERAGHSLSDVLLALLPVLEAQVPTMQAPLHHTLGAGHSVNSAGQFETSATHLPDSQSTGSAGLVHLVVDAGQMERSVSVLTHWLVDAQWNGMGESAEHLLGSGQSQGEARHVESQHFAGREPGQVTIVGHSA